MNLSAVSLNLSSLGAFKTGHQLKLENIVMMCFVV
jgi:hypothetical protein